jgi:predicted ABC-type ATPase
MSSPRGGLIRVLAGVNGAGKSSIAGASIRAEGGAYYNPDEAARTVLLAHPHLTQARANILAWEAGREALERAIRENGRFSFETTLGGRTIPALLGQASAAGIPVEMLYVGLNSIERHKARVRARVLRGGHDIPPEKIAERYTSSRANLVRLLPHLARLVVFDNSAEADPDQGMTPEPGQLLAMRGDRIEAMVARDDVPDWAAPIVAAAILRHRGSNGPMSGQ